MARRKVYKKIDKILPEIEAMVESTIRQAEEAAVKALDDITQNVWMKADEYVPKDTEALRNSVDIEQARVVERNRRAGNSLTRSRISYGNSEVDYAWFVHENKPNPPEVKNYTAGPTTGPKYLQKAINEEFTPEKVRESLLKHLKNIK